MITTVLSSSPVLASWQTGISAELNRVLRRLTVAVSIAILAGCGGDSDRVDPPPNPPPPAPTTGSITVSISTSGAASDAEYSLLVGSRAPENVLAQSDTTISGLASGVTTIGLDDIACNCRASGEVVPRTVNVVAGADTAVDISVECSDPTAVPPAIELTAGAHEVSAVNPAGASLAAWSSVDGRSIGVGRFRPGATDFDNRRDVLVRPDHFVSRVTPLLIGDSLLLAWDGVLQASPGAMRRAEVQAMSVVSSTLTPGAVSDVFPAGDSVQERTLLSLRDFGSGQAVALVSDLSAGQGAFKLRELRPDGTTGTFSSELTGAAEQQQATLGASSGDLGVARANTAAGMPALLWQRLDGTGAVVSETVIDATPPPTTIGIAQPAVVWAGDRYLVLWWNQTDYRMGRTFGRLFGAAVGSDGQQIGAKQALTEEVDVTSFSDFPRIGLAYSAGWALGAFMNPTGSLSSILLDAGLTIERELAVAVPAPVVSGPDVSVLPDGFLLMWSGGSSENATYTRVCTP